MRKCLPNSFCLKVSSKLQKEQECRNTGPAFCFQTPNSKRQTLVDAKYFVLLSFKLAPSVPVAGGMMGAGLSCWNRVIIAFPSSSPPGHERLRGEQEEGGFVWFVPSLSVLFTPQFTGHQTHFSLNQHWLLQIHTVSSECGPEVLSTRRQQKDSFSLEISYVTARKQPTFFPLQQKQQHLAEQSFMFWFFPSCFRKEAKKIRLATHHPIECETLPFPVPVP